MSGGMVGQVAARQAAGLIVKMIQVMFSAQKFKTKIATIFFRREKLPDVLFL